MAYYQRHVEGEKNYKSGEFRGQFPDSTAYSGDVRRHKYDCEMAKAAAEYMPGPRYGAATIRDIRSVLSQPDNVHYYGAKTANGKDQVAVGKVIEGYHTGERRVVLSPHEVAHIREGARHLAAHKGELPRSFIEANKNLYANVYDVHGNKVVDNRWFK